MNIKEFIETSGVLEEYVMGTLSEQEMQGVQCLSQTYPEIEAEILKLDQSLEKYVFLHQRTPPAMLKEKLFAQMTFDDPIEETEQIEEDFDTVMTISEPDETSETTTASKGKQVFPTWGVISVAASVLLLAVAGWLVTQNNSLKNTNDTLAAQVEAIEENNQKNASLLAAYADPENKIITLKGLEKAKDSNVTVFWNQESNQVALRVNNLPKPASDEQYQLWTIVDGKPVDMGVIDNDFQEKLLAMKAVTGSPVAFAITLEKAGGSPTPTLEEMYVMGEV